jgi:hypothetical protein
MIDFKKIGFMQGRLVPSYNNQIQFFPHNKWEKELKVANHLRIRKVEWTINYKNLYKNPIFYKTKINKIKKIIKKNNINLNSVTCDFFMEKPFFKIINKNDKKKEINLLLKIIKHCRLLNINLIILPLLDNSSIASSSEEKELMRTLKLIQNYLGDTQMFLLWFVTLLKWPTSFHVTRRSLQRSQPTCLSATVTVYMVFLKSLFLTEILSSLGSFGRALWES